MTIQERLEEVENKVARVNRRGRWLLAAIVLAAGMWTAFVGLDIVTPNAIAAAQGRDQKTIRAKAFILVDRDGKRRGSLQVVKGGTMLALCDTNGKTRASLGVTAEGPAVKLYHEKGKLPFRVALGVLKDGAVLNLRGEKGEIRASLAVVKGEARLILGNGKDKRCAQLLMRKGCPGLSLTDEKGEPRIMLILARNGASLLSLFDEKGEQRIGLIVLKDMSGLTLWNQKAQMRAGVGVDKAGPRIELRDEKGKRIWWEGVAD